jgi:hypothetical protein
VFDDLFSSFRKLKFKRRTYNETNMTDIVSEPQKLSREISDKIMLYMASPSAVLMNDYFAHCCQVCRLDTRQTKRPLDCPSNHEYDFLPYKKERIELFYEDLTCQGEVIDLYGDDYSFRCNHKICWTCASRILKDEDHNLQATCQVCKVFLGYSFHRDFLSEV